MLGGRASSRLLRQGLGQRVQLLLESNALALQFALTLQVFFSLALQQGARLLQFTDTGLAERFERLALPAQIFDGAVLPPQPVLLLLE